MRPCCPQSLILYCSAWILDRDFGAFYTRIVIQGIDG